jgi:hypothetical protein
MLEVVIVVIPVKGSVVVEKSGTGSCLFQMAMLLASEKIPGTAARSIRIRSGVRTVNRAVACTEITVALLFATGLPHHEIQGIWP